MASGDGRKCDRCDGPRAADDDCLAIAFGEWSSDGPSDLTLCGICEASLSLWIEAGQDEDYRGDDGLGEGETGEA